MLKTIYKQRIPLFYRTFDSNPCFKRSACRIDFEFIIVIVLTDVSNGHRVFAMLNFRRNDRTTIVK